MTLRCSSSRSGRPSSGGALLEHPVAHGLGHPARPQQGGVGGHDHGPEPSEQDEPDGPDPCGVGQARRPPGRRTARPGARRRAAPATRRCPGTRRRSARRRTRWRPCRRCRACGTGRRRRPRRLPGRSSEMALPASWAVITENHALVRRAMRCRENVQAKWAPSATTAGMNQSRLSVASLGHECRTDRMLGRHEVERRSR